MALKGLGERLRAARAAAGHTQQAVSNALGYTPATIANYERERTEPEPSDLARLARLYRVTLDWLMTGEPHLEHRFEPVRADRCEHGTPVRDRCRQCEREAASA